jgi:hypothetical protein
MPPAVVAGAAIADERDRDVAGLEGLAVSAAPQIKGGPPPTMPFAPIIPLDRSAMCIEPPLPPHRPSLRPKISAIMALGSQPFAMQWPWPRWVDAMQSWSFRCMQTPTPDASSPAYRWTKPGMLPAENSS